MAMPELLRHWFTVEQSQGRLTPQASADYLNARMGTRYTQNRVGEWRSGARSIPSEVQELMRADVMLLMLYECGIDATAAQAERLTKSLSAVSSPSAKN